MLFSYADVMMHVSGVQAACSSALLPAQFQPLPHLYRARRADAASAPRRLRLRASAQPEESQECCQRPSAVDRAQEQEGQVPVLSRRALSFGMCACCGALLPQAAHACQDRYNLGFAYGMAYGMADYEIKVHDLKESLFSQALDGLEAPQIVDVGIGSGPNLQYLAKKKGVHITGVDPNSAMLPFAQDSAEQAGLQTEQLSFANGLAEALPGEAESADLVVCTLVLCSVDSVEKALQEAKRVLRPGGRFVFVEHCLAPTSKPILRIAQQVLNPIQIRLADGCHLNRNPLPLIKQTFQVQQAEEFILEGESMIAPHVAGWAVKSA